MKHYHKLVRDRIPEIITRRGATCDLRQLDLQEYGVHLDNKLGEELHEYLETRDVTELADLIEVVYAILGHKGISLAEFEAMRLAKRQERGGFEQRLLLLTVDEPL